MKNYVWFVRTCFSLVQFSNFPPELLTDFPGVSYVLNQDSNHLGICRACITTGRPWLNTAFFGLLIKPKSPIFLGAFPPKSHFVLVHLFLVPGSPLVSPVGVVCAASAYTPTTHVKVCAPRTRGAHHVRRDWSLVLGWVETTCPALAQGESQ